MRRTQHEQASYALLFDDRASGRAVLRISDTAGLAGVYYSFTNWNGFGDNFDFIGFKNYVNLFKDGNVGNAYWFTFKFAVVVTILINIFSLLIAMGLNARIKARNFFRGIYFLPNILSVLIIGYIFNYLFSNVFTIWGQNLGIEWLSTNILGSEQHAWIGIVVVAVWRGIAYNTILYLAGSRLSLKHCTRRPTSMGRTVGGILENNVSADRAILYDQHGACDEEFLMVFDQIVALTNGGPGRATQSISHLIYTGGFEGVCLSIRELRDLLHPDCHDIDCADSVPAERGGHVMRTKTNWTVMILITLGTILILFRCI